DGVLPGPADRVQPGQLRRWRRHAEHGREPRPGRGVEGLAAPRWRLRRRPAGLHPHVRGLAAQTGPAAARPGPGTGTDRSGLPGDRCRAGSRRRDRPALRPAPPRVSPPGGGRAPGQSVRRTLAAVVTPDESPLARKRRARRMARELAIIHPDAHCELNYDNPLQLTVATILSAQTT